jgi:hypothetical protein
MKENVYLHLENIKTEINNKYGFEGNIPRINYGPCGVFAYIFHKEWNIRFKEKVHMCFIMENDFQECYHVCISFEDSSLFDGGIGVHNREYYRGFDIVDMQTYDHSLLEKWSYGLDRTYPRFCPDFNKKFVESVIVTNLNQLL